MAKWFAIIELLLKLFGVWDQFLKWSQAKKIAEDAKKKKAREDAIEDSKHADDDDAIWDSQDRIVGNKP